MSSLENHSVSKPRRPHRDARRLYVVGIGMVLGLVAIAVRLVMLQIVHGDDYANQARRQYESKVTLQAQRGSLYDRNGNLLATNMMSYSFAVDPRHVENPRNLAQAFARACGDTPEAWYEKIAQEGTSFVWLKRKVTGPAMLLLKDVQDDGLIKLKEPLRHFEYASLGAQAIGCTDIDNNGLSGVELYYNEQLKGTAGYMVMQRDARGRRRPDIDLPQAKPEHGDALMLTIDINVQGIVEDELRKGVEIAGAESGTAIALDPRTGELLAIASYPSYDPNDLKNAEQSTIRVRAITDTYEPGSTMKLVTAAAALEEKAIASGDSINTEGGIYQLGQHAIRDEHPAATMTFRQAIEESSNIAFAKIAAELPAPRFYKYVRDFGFGIISGIDLPGEARGDVKKPNEFSEGTQEFMAFGYQLAVTPLQLACAYAAIANGGVMMKPHLLRRRVNREGEITQEIESQEIRRVVSQETADTLRDLLIGVVEHGTGQQARIAGLKIAGKTGTSQQLAGGAYSKEKYNASFVGFFPAEDPKVTLLVLLDSPKNGYYGGQVAAPIFREIARRIVNAMLEGSDPDVRFTSQSVTPVPTVTEIAGGLYVPDLRGTGVDIAREIGEKLGFRVMVQGEGKLVAMQEPRPGTPTDARSVITLRATGIEEPRRMPNLRGMSLRRALNVLTSYHIRPRVSGSGIVRSQNPLPNAVLNPRSAAVLTCDAEEP